MREQREILEHQADAPLLGRQAPTRLGDEAAADLDAAGLYVFQPGDQPQRGRLAAAGRADEAMHLAGRDREADRIDHQPLAEAVAERLDHETRGAAHAFGWRGASAICVRRIEQGGTLQLVQPRQIVQGTEVELVEKGRRRHPGHRPPRCLAPPGGLHPAGLDQLVQSPCTHGDAAHGLDLGPGHRLLVGDHRQRLQRSTGKAARAALDPDRDAVPGRRPFGRPSPAHAAPAARHGRHSLSQLGQHRGDFGPAAQSGLQLALLDRLGRREEQRFHQALRVRCRRLCGPGSMRHARRRSMMGPKGVAWVISMRPMRASSRLATRLAASAERRPKPPTSSGGR